MNLKTKLLPILKKTNLLVGLGIYLMAAGISFAVFSSSARGSEIVSPLTSGETEDGEMVFFTGPRDQACPINGAKYTKEQRDIWEKRRPLVVMIENHEDSRPQSGISRADVVYEAVAEGGITRFLAVFYCGATEPVSRKYDLGPVRSARTYFLDWASEYSDYPLYVHVGGAGLCHDTTVDSRAKALCQIENYGWKDKEHWSDMDQFALSYKVCRREPERTGRTVATEHTMYCSSEALWETAAKRGLEAKAEETGNSWDEDFISWKFKDGAEADERGGVKEINFNFWKGYQAYAVKWDYQSDNNQYLRSNGEGVQKDLVGDKPIGAGVVIVQFAKEIGPVDDHKHLLYQTIGSGKAIVFQDGEAIKANWSKEERQSRTIFTDASGKEIKFNRGLIWVEILPIGSEVDYEAS